MKKIYPLLTAVFLACSFPAWPWGGKGHKIIVQIAKGQLSQSVIDSVDYYLDGVTWEEAACWMDKVHEDRTYEFMKPWHYVNIKKDNTYVATTNPNIINELEFLIPAIENRKKYTREKTGMYLKILFHLVGDIHQPLHCGYPEDHGGNDLSGTFFEKNTTLHKLWDSEIIREKKIDEKACLRLLKSWPPEQIDEIKKAKLLDWVNGSKALLPMVYSFKETTSHKYVVAATANIKDQLTKAGLRLAGTLEECFKK